MSHFGGTHFSGTHFGAQHFDTIQLAASVTASIAGQSTVTANAVRTGAQTALITGASTIGPVIVQVQRLGRTAQIDSKSTISAVATIDSDIWTEAGAPEFVDRWTDIPVQEDTRR